MHNTKRFVEINTRKFDSFLFKHSNVTELSLNVKYTKWNKSKWKGLVFMKDPACTTIYMQLLQDLKPRTIIEFGTFEGGSAVWMNDLMSTMDVNFHIHTFDINSANVKIAPCENITFHHMDNYKVLEFIEKNRTLLENLPHPILMIEDSHENFVEVLNHFDQFLQPGDYVIVEDTIEKEKHDAMIPYIEQHNLKVDTYYCDFWGYNNSYNLNSFLKKF